MHTDWWIATGRDLRAVIADCQLPVNHLVYPHNPQALAESMQNMLSEQLRQQYRWQHRNGLQLQDFLLLFQRGLQEQASTEGNPLVVRLGHVRHQVHSQLAQQWTVERMAALTDLSRNHFAQRYRHFFGLSPIEDLMRARIRQACILLARGGHSVGECARLVGFRDVPWFSRCFHERVGCSPRAFARQPRRLPVPDL